MFEYNIDLFKSACNKTSNALLSLEELKNTIIELESLSENYEGRDDVCSAITNILKATNELSNLYDDMLTTLSNMIGSAAILDSSLSLDSLNTALELFENSFPFL